MIEFNLSFKGKHKFVFYILQYLVSSKEMLRHNGNTM